MTIESLAILVVLMMISLFGFGLTTIFILFLSRDTTKIPEILNRITNLESSVQTWMTTSSQESEVDSWKTADGKYTANSFEELLTIMAQDPDGPLTPEEIDAIKSIFSKIMGNKLNRNDDQQPWE